VCREVCRDWCWVASPSLGNRSQLEIDSEDEGALDTYSRLPSLPMARSKAFRNIHLSRVSISFSSDDIASKWAWGPVFSSITSLTLVQCPLSSTDFVRILSHLVRTDSSGGNLKHLGMISAGSDLFSGMFLSEPADVGIASRALNGVVRLDLRRNELSDLVFKRLTDCCPNIRCLDISDTRIQHQPGVYKKYYSNKGDSDSLASPEVFTYKAVIKFLKERALKVKELALEDTCLSESVLQEIAAVPNLQLQMLNIARNPAIKHGTLHIVAQLQKSLTDLDISSCNRAFMDCSPETISAIFRSLGPSLKRLKLYGLSVPRGFDQCVANLGTQLRVLNVKCLDAPSRAMADGLTKNKACAASLHRLTMSAFASIPLQLGRILSMTTNLRQLDLRSSATALTDSVMRVICCYLPNLTHLNLRGCHQLTSFGFLGPNFKKAPTDMVENDFTDFVDTGQDISNLQKLVNLNISGLKIGDEVFEHLRLNELRALHVSDNFHITARGFQHMVDNNPCIVWFAGSKCSQLEDSSVIHMLKGWRRLVRLEINKNICLKGDFLNHLGSAKYITYLSAKKLGVRQSEDIKFKRGGQVRRQHLPSQETVEDNLLGHDFDVDEAVLNRLM